MTPPATIGDNDLHAFIDGELDAGERAEVEAWLADHPDDAARVEAWGQDKAGLHETFDGVLDEKLPPQIEAAMAGPPRRGRPRGWMRAAAAILLLAVGAGSGWFARGELERRDSTEFLRQAVSAHVVHVGERRHAVEVWAKEERHLVAWLSKRLKHKIKAPVLAGVGFRLVGGRLVADEGAPAAQFMYEDKAGRRVTLYTRRIREDGQTAFRFVGRGGVAAFYWIEGPLAFALLGKMPREDLLPIAQIVYSDLKKLTQAAE